MLHNVSNYYPVITLVLYFGNTKWKKPRRLFDLFEVPQELKPFTNDYKMNLFDISHMSTKEVSVFKSDFWHIADYFSQINETNSYIPSKTRLTHPEETFKLMSFLTGNEDLQLLPCEEEGGPNTMYDAFKANAAQAKKEGIQESRLNDIRALMNNCHWSAKQAMDALSISLEEQKKYLMLL